MYSPCSAANPPEISPYVLGGVCARQHDGKLTADGWTLDYETWQGVRTSDLAIGQWNTPDAFAGEVHDPMSQKPFMWNRNNPYRYSDPSDYTWEPFEKEVQQIVDTLSAKSPTFREYLAAAKDSSIPFTMTLVPMDDVRKTSMPNKENAGVAHTAFGRDKSGTVITSGTVSIGRGDTRTMTAAVAAEVFNAGSAAKDPVGYLVDLYAKDAEWGTVAERKGAEGQLQILKEAKWK